MRSQVMNNELDAQMHTELAHLLSSIIYKIDAPTKPNYTSELSAANMTMCLAFFYT